MVTVSDEAPTNEDAAPLAAASKELHNAGWAKAFTMGEMLGGWRRLVREIEVGYTMTVDDYTNDLTSRDWLDLVLDRVTDPMRKRIERDLEPLDRRYRDATIDDGGAALAHFFRIDAKGGWWWRRRPTLLTGELAEDLQRAGVIEGPATT
jgi:hypothetical protein